MTNRWKKVWWWQDALGGYLYLAEDGRVLHHIYKLAYWETNIKEDYEWVRFVELAQAKRYVEEFEAKKIGKELAENLEKWYRDVNE